MSEKINIALVDDHTMFMDGLESIFNMEQDLYVAGKFDCADKMLDFLDNFRVELVITDVNMPGMDGIQLVKEIKSRRPETKVLGLSMHDQPHIINKMIKAGINGYLLKDCERNELLEAVRAINKGDNYFAENVKEALLSVQSKRKGMGNIELTDREREVLKLIADELTQKEIADKLFISTHTVIYHRRNLLAKLDVKNTAGLIKCAVELGLVD